MTEKFKIEITTPGKLVFKDQVEMAVIPGEDGEFGILPGHSPVISNLKPGLINVYEKDQITKRIFVAGGFVEVNATETSVLATDAYDVSQVSRDEVNQKIESATIRLNTADNDFEKNLAQETIAINQQLLGYIS